MEKEFVPYELALRMKKLKSMDKGFRHGFNEKTFAYFVEGFPNDKLIISSKPKLYSYEYNGGGPELISAPTWQSAFRWFREKYGLFSSEVYDRGLDNGKLPIIHSYSFRILNLNNFEDFYGDTFDIYEEAELACLTKLIEIVEQNK
jgi:hypothetical protein